MTGPTIRWTEQATRQLDQAHDYIALSNSEEVAERIATQIVTTIQQLTAFPMSGRSGPGSGYSRVGHLEYALYRSLHHRS